MIYAISPNNLRNHQEPKLPAFCSAHLSLLFQDRNYCNLKLKEKAGYDALRAREGFRWGLASMIYSDISGDRQSYFETGCQQV
jgi:hypothetical protein